MFTAYPGEVFKGKVLFVSDVLDPDTRRTKVRIAFDNPDMRFKPNMFANATFYAPVQNVPVVPTNALVLKNDPTRCSSKSRRGRSRRATSISAFSRATTPLSHSGVKAGDRVVVKGGVLLND